MAWTTVSCEQAPPALLCQHRWSWLIWSKCKYLCCWLKFQPNLPRGEGLVFKQRTESTAARRLSRNSSEPLQIIKTLVIGWQSQPLSSTPEFTQVLPALGNKAIIIILDREIRASRPKCNPLYCISKQVISVGRKTLPSALCFYANGGHRFPGCGQNGEPPGDEGGVKFVTEQIWPLVSAHHLNPNLISNVKYTPSPLLAFLNKWPPDTERGKGG